MCRHSSIFCVKLLSVQEKDLSWRRVKKRVKILLELIDGYSFPALSQIKSKEYSYRQKKDSAYETLLIKYREYYKKGTKDKQLKKKLNAFLFASSSFAGH